jgi:signal transduction histidine kinase
LFTHVYNQLLVFGVLEGPLSNFPVFLAALLMMAFELGRDFIVSRRERLELTELRAQIAQEDRIGVMGQLSSALAHELSQPLTATSANVEALLAQLSREEPDLEELRSIAADIGSDHHRAGEIINGMRQLFKRRSIEMKPISVQNLVEDIVSLVRSEATCKHVALQFQIEPGIPLVVGDRVHLMQVLLNLLMNSIDAVQSRPADHRRIVVEAKVGDAKGGVEIAVRDTGPGIPDSIVAEVFKPFFTTKSKGLGTGLALARTIVEAHGGRLWIDGSPQQEGATFRFSLRPASRPGYLAEKDRDPSSAREVLAREVPANNPIS